MVVFEEPGSISVFLNGFRERRLYVLAKRREKDIVALRRLRNYYWLKSLGMYSDVPTTGSVTFQITEHYFERF